MSLTRVTLALALVMALTLIAGCGKKGPLYHPDPEPAEQPAAPAAPTPGN